MCACVPIDRGSGSTQARTSCTFATALFLCLLSAFAELSPGVKWRVAGNIPFASVSGARLHTERRPS